MKKILVLISFTLLFVGCSQANVSQTVKDDMTELVILHHETYINESKYLLTDDKLTLMYSRQANLSNQYFNIADEGEFSKSERGLIDQVHELVSLSLDHEMVQLGIKQVKQDILNENLIKYRDAYNDMKDKLNITDEKIDEVLAFIR